MSVSVDIVSVGTLSRNRLWGESASMRPAHATTTLLRDGSTSIVVDPSLPAEILRQRLDERSGLKPEQIDAVFLTNFRPIHRRGIDLFQQATWLMDGAEIEAMGAYLNDLVSAAEARGEPVDELVEQELKLLQRLEAAPERVTEEVHLFPSSGVTPGAASLLILDVARTTAIAGDAVISKEYFARRQAFELHSHAGKAVEAIAELAEIADIIIPGHGDWILNV